MQDQFVCIFAKHAVFPAQNKAALCKRLCA